jgi:phage repressor protein C with HTH and peptisase S24 domain
MDVRKFLDEQKNARGIEKDAEFAEKIGVSLEALNKWVQRNKLPYKWEIELGQNVQQDKAIYIPKLSVTASAGEGGHLESIDAFDENGTLIIDADTLRIKDFKKLKAIRVDGYSMIPALLPDSWVIFNNEQTFAGDGLYVINWRNILMVKQIQLSAEGQLEIISVNPQYKSYVVTPDDQSVFCIIGKVLRAII